MEDNLDLTSTDDNVSTVMDSVPVIATDQSFQNLDETANSTPDLDDTARSTSVPLPVQPDEHEPAGSSEHVDSSSVENTSTPLDEVANSKGNHPSETTALEALSCDTALCDENATSSEVLLTHDQTSNDDATSFTVSSDISENQIDPAAQTNEQSYSNCANFDKPYSVDVEDLSKIEKSNNLIASDLISSETMNDFFDEMYDMNYANHYKNRKVEESNLAQNYCADQIDGNLKEQDWSATASESNFCNPDDEKDSAAVKSSLKRIGEPEPSNDFLPCKKARKGITFDSVSVYYFPRTQGFTCIPSQGGSTLGMSWNHTHIRKFSLGEHAAEQRKAHRQMCSQQLDSSTNWNELSNISSEDSDSDEIVSDSEVDYENYNFLQPIPTRERRAMLRAAGIQKIDSREKDECRTIRLSREFCGCTCQIYCDPERCVCAQAGIKCQVDRMNFPCSCTRDGCANENGRVEFNPMRVRTHFIHTLMRLEMEKKKEEEAEHNHRLLFGELDNMAQLSYPASALAQSSSASSSSNLLTTFTYHPDSLPYYAQPPPQPSLYDVSQSPAPSESGQLPAFSYDSQYAMAANEYSQLSSNLTMLGENTSLTSSYAMGELRLAGANYEESAMAQLRQTGFHDDSATLRTTSAFHTVEPLFGVDEVAKEPTVECHSESEALDTSAEVSEETEKEESDVENFGDIIKKTMVESVIA